MLVLITTIRGEAPEIEISEHDHTSQAHVFMAVAERINQAIARDRTACLYRASTGDDGCRVGRQLLEYEAVRRSSLSVAVRDELTSMMVSKARTAHAWGFVSLIN